MQTVIECVCYLRKKQTVVKITVFSSMSDVVLFYVSFYYRFMKQAYSDNILGVVHSGSVLDV